MRPDFDAIRGKCLSELTPDQEEHAHELWLRENARLAVNDASMRYRTKGHIEFLIDRLDRERKDSQLLIMAAKRALEYAPNEVEANVLRAAIAAAEGAA